MRKSDRRKLRYIDLSQTSRDRVFLEMLNRAVTSQTFHATTTTTTTYYYYYYYYYLTK